MMMMMMMMMMIEVVGIQFERSANAYTLHTVIGES
jgi:hypothetical protein